MEKEITLVQDVITDLLGQIGIKSTPEVSENDGALVAIIDAGDDNALLIGKHGNTLSALELLVNVIVSQKLGEFKRVTLEIGNYRAEREQYLIDLVEKLRAEVLETDSSRQIRGLKPWERRFVHLQIQDDSDVFTESEGEDRDRVLVIKKK